MQYSCIHLDICSAFWRVVVGAVGVGAQALRAALLRRTHRLAHTTQQQDTQQTSMEREEERGSNAAPLLDEDAYAAAALAHLGATTAAAAADARQSDAPMAHAYLILPLQLIACDAPVACACWCVDAPHVPSCSRPRVDSSGWPACEECGRRLSTCKGKLYKRDPGRICQSCFDTQRRGARRTSSAASLSPGSVEETIKRSHKRRATSDPGQSAADNAVALTPAPLPLHKQSTWPSHRWALRPSCRRSRATAAAWHALISSGELRQWAVKRGGFYQHDTHLSLTCSLVDAVRVRLLSGSEQQGRDILHEQGVDSSTLQLAGLKIVRMATGEGEQEIHYDIPEYDLAMQCYTVLLYLVSTLSTAVSSLPLEKIRESFSSSDARPSAAALKMLRREVFYSTRVEAGDAMVLRCDVPHFGVANPDAHTRYVAFMMFSPRGMQRPDTEQQRYPHGVED